MHHFDPLMAPTPFNQQMYDEALPNHSHNKVKVGFIKEMEFLPVSPAVRRAMDIAKKGLEDAGYEIVDFKLTHDDYQRGTDYLMGVLTNTSVKYFDVDF